MILEFLNLFRIISDNNISILSEYINTLESFLSILDLNLLRFKKKSLTHELELSKIKDKSSILSAKTDLLNKLNKNIIKTEEKLSFLGKDFFNIRDQRDQILKTIDKNKNQIRDLSNQKKQKFSEINKITRSMEDPNFKKDNSFMETDLSNSEMIMKLREEAKSVHDEINRIKSNLDLEIENLDKIDPKFKVYEKDYNSLKSTIENQEIQIKKIQNEIKQILSDNNQDQFNKIKPLQLNNIRSHEEIQKEMDYINREMKQIKNSIQDFNENNIKNFKNINNQISNIIKNIKTNNDNLIFPPEIKIITSSIAKFRDLELLTNNIEQLINQFLITINLEINFNIKIDNKDKKFLIQPNFIRNNKESSLFKELTTPEKIFFVVMFFISIMIVLNNKDIIFSNLFINQRFNKRGSLFRTIEKIVPIFESNKDLKDFNLIFLISNLEMKKTINNINLIEI